MAVVVDKSVYKSQDLTIKWWR